MRMNAIRRKRKPFVRGIMTYEQARKAFETMEKYAELEDQVELDASRYHLMQNPTKAAARDLYVRAIRLWHGEHGGQQSDPTILSALMKLGLSYELPERKRGWGEGS